MEKKGTTKCVCVCALFRAHRETAGNLYVKELAREAAEVLQVERHRLRGVREL